MVTDTRTAIIDIGSNSIRLVVYQGPARLPAVLFNEKVLAGLGRGVAATGTIDDAALALAGRTLSRFAALARTMSADRVRTVATAAVRDAANGHEVIRLAEQVGLSVELLSGEDEARAAGDGVLSAIPSADGIVGDLGGGSLELVRIADGRTGERVSFPLGVLRLGAIRAKGPGALKRQVRQAIASAGWLGAGIGLPLYLVGGSWRALARLDMHESGHPLPIIHGYTMALPRIDALVDRLRGGDRGWLRSVPGLSGGRVPTLSDGAALLSALLDALGGQETVVSAFGLREGLLFGALDPATRMLDPLIVGARDEGRRLARFPEHGNLLDRWITPLFVADTPGDARLRHAACLLADTSWRANPEFRVERGLETALHGNWVAIDARGRVMLAIALAASMGAGSPFEHPAARLASPADTARARSWGLAIRLAQRLSGGVAAPLERSRIERRGDRLVLACADADEALWGEAVDKRLRALATALALKPELAGPGLVTGATATAMPAA